MGQKTWVSYYNLKESSSDLPIIRTGILTPLEGFDSEQLDDDTIQRLNFFYARDYDWTKDLELIWKGFSYLGR